MERVARAAIATGRTSNDRMPTLWDGRLTGNGLTHPHAAAFDGQRVLVTNLEDDTVSLWKAASLTGLGFVSTGAGTFPQRACSDGVSFWITLSSSDKLARFRPLLTDAPEEISHTAICQFRHNDLLELRVETVLAESLLGRIVELKIV